MKTAKCQFLGTMVRLYDGETNEDIAVVSMTKAEIRTGKPGFVARVQHTAHNLGYTTPFIYPDNSGNLRIWL